MFVFITWTCCCVAMTGHVEVGLDVELALSRDSYLLDYVHQLSATIKLGPWSVFLWWKMGMSTIPLMAKT